MTDTAPPERVGQIEIEDGSVLLYDVEEPNAWIQSDNAVESGSIV
jgi:hypothetical protein